MIKVMGAVACEDAVIESDPWIPLKITWLPRPPGQPLYLRVSGEGGGELEFKIDPETGALVQIIVIESPPPFASISSAHRRAEQHNQVPTIDRSLWLENLADKRNERSVVSIVEALEAGHTERQMTLAFSNLEASSYLRCGNVLVGISPDGFLVEITALI